MKRNRVRLYLFGLLIGGLLAGCTTGAVEEIVPEESRPITLSFGKPDLGVPDVVTRADTPAPTPLPEGATVRICAYFTGKLSDASTTPAVFSTTAPSFEATYVVGADGALSPCQVDDSGKQIAGDAGGLTVRGGLYDFYAVSPARKLAKDTDNNYKITGIQHKEDVMTSTIRNVKVSNNSSQVTLGTFQRKCALVVFNVVPSPDNEFPIPSLYGTGLVIKKISSSDAGLIAGDGPSIPPTGGATGAEAEVTFAENEFEPVAPESDPDKIGLNKTKGIVLPKTNDPFDVEITVVRYTKTAILKATIDKNITFDAGKRYIFTLEVKETESSLLMRVVDWNIVAFTDENVGGPDKPYPDPDINEGIGTTITVARWTEIPWSGNGDIGGNN